MSGTVIGQVYAAATESPTLLVTDLIGLRCYLSTFGPRPRSRVRYETQVFSERSEPLGLSFQFTGMQLTRIYSSRTATGMLYGNAREWKVTVIAKFLRIPVTSAKL